MQEEENYNLLKKMKLMKYSFENEKAVLLQKISFWEKTLKQQQLKENNLRDKYLKILDFIEVWRNDFNILDYCEKWIIQPQKLGEFEQKKESFLNKIKDIYGKKEMINYKNKILNLENITNNIKPKIIKNVEFSNDFTKQISKDNEISDIQHNKILNNLKSFNIKEDIFDLSNIKNTNTKTNKTNNNIKYKKIDTLKFESINISKSKSRLNSFTDSKNNFYKKFENKNTNKTEFININPNIENNIKKRVFTNKITSASLKKKNKNISSVRNSTDKEFNKLNIKISNKANITIDNGEYSIRLKSSNKQKNNYFKQYFKKDKNIDEFQNILKEKFKNLSKKFI